MLQFPECSTCLAGLRLKKADVESVFYVPKRDTQTPSVSERAGRTEEPSSYACSLMAPLSIREAFKITKFSSVKEEILLNDLYLD